MRAIKIILTFAACTVAVATGTTTPAWAWKPGQPFSTTCMPGLFTSGTSYFTRGNCTEGKRLRAKYLQYLRMINPSELGPHRAAFYFNAGRGVHLYHCIGDGGDGRCDEYTGNNNRADFGRFIRRAFEWSPNVY
jgi:hypothetical protein